jgi:hypothetical protein
VSYDRKEFLDTVSKKAQERTANVMPLLRAVQAVAPVMEKLLTDTHWDHYLAYLQGYVNQAKAAKENAQAKLSDPAVWDTGQLTKLKSDIIVADAMIEAWTTAMQLPKALISGAEEANKTIARFENASAGQAQP